MLIKGPLSQAKGSYVLWFYLPRRTRIAIGRLGVQNFSRGWYGYCGSAFGPGGLRARLRHHLSPARRCHWHIDYFKTHASVREIWLCEGVNREHELSRILLAGCGSEIPVPGFGAADCRCDSHFVLVSAAARVKALFGRITVGNGAEPLESLSPAISRMSVVRTPDGITLSAI